MIEIGNYIEIGADLADPRIARSALFILVLRQYGAMFSVTASDLNDDQNVFILDDKNVTRV